MFFCRFIGKRSAFHSLGMDTFQEKKRFAGSRKKKKAEDKTN